jgi:hypothetical protein
MSSRQALGRSGYQITDYTKRKAKEIGVIVKPSTRKNKKLDVFKDGEKVASIGDTRYLDYPNYIKRYGKEVADERRRLYHARHTRKTSNEKLSKHLLW